MIKNFNTVKERYCYICIRNYEYDDVQINHDHYFIFGVPRDLMEEFT